MARNDCDQSSFNLKLKGFHYNFCSKVGSKFKYRRADNKLVASLAFRLHAYTKRKFVKHELHRHLKLLYFSHPRRTSNNIDHRRFRHKFKFKIKYSCFVVMSGATKQRKTFRAWRDTLHRSKAI